jgi:hypothetical protein
MSSLNGDAPVSLSADMVETDNLALQCRTGLLTMLCCHRCACRDVMRDVAAGHVPMHDVTFSWRCVAATCSDAYSGIGDARAC